MTREVLWYDSERMEDNFDPRLYGPGRGGCRSPAPKQTERHTVRDRARESRVKLWPDTQETLHEQHEIG